MFAAIVINADGLLRMAGSQQQVGGANPLLGPITAALGIGLLLVWSRGEAMLSRQTSGISVFFLLLAATLVAFGLFTPTSSTTKLFRDLTYVTLFYVFFLNGTWWLTHDRFSMQAFVRTVAVCSLMLGPAVALFAWGLDPGNRFGGLVMSYPMFAVVALLLAVLSSSVDEDGLWRLIVVTVALLSIVVSGTRSVLAIFLIIVPLLAWRTANAREIRTVAAVAVGAVIAAVTGALLVRWILASTGMTPQELRIFSVEDAAVGSIASRYVWVSVAWAHIVESGLVGGFGAGASEDLLGVLPHFDFLRFWFDYSVFSVAFLGALVTSMILPGLRSIWDPLAISMLGVTTVLTTHNIFQTPGPLLLAALSVAAVRFSSTRALRANALTRKNSSAISPAG